MVMLKNFGANGIEFELYGFIEDVNATGEISSELRFSILKCLHAEGIAHPGATGAPLNTQQLEAAFANLARSIEQGRMEGGAARDAPKRAAGRG